MMEHQMVPTIQSYAVKFPAGKDVIDTVIAQIATLNASSTMTAFEPMKDMTFEVIEKLGTTLVTSKNTSPPSTIPTKATNTSLTLAYDD